MTTKTLDIGCGKSPKNPFSMDEVYGIDIYEDIEKKVFRADLAVESIPFPDEFFDGVSAFDFIEHMPRVIYMPERRFCFVELMNEVYRVLKTGGTFLSFTPAFPASAAWRDPTHVNIITEETFPLYFDYQNRGASAYGFNGFFQVVSQQWHENKIHLITEMVKVVPIDPPLEK
jgi:SAM-dependent methyltransferase